MSTLSKELAEEIEGWRAAGRGRTLALPCGVDLTSNDYLGLSRHPRVRGAAAAAIARYGAGAPAARLLRGELPPHRDAEAACARWLGEERALLFPSGYQANLALISSLAGPGSVIFSDALNHASLIDGCRLARGSVQVFPHSDPAALEALLAGATEATRRLVVVERVYSMDGDEAPLAALLSLCARYDAWLLLDEAHAAGLYPPRLDDLPHRERIAARVITGGKALGVAGAFVAGSAALRELLVHRGRSFVFTTATPPPIAAALRASIELLEAAPERGAILRRRAQRLRSRLREAGLQVPGSSPILPIILGSEERTVAAAQALQERGWDLRAVRPPTVAPGSSRLRLVVHEAHDDALLERLAGDLLAVLAGELQPVPPRPPMPRAVVICGTDTDAGKTVGSALVVAALARAGHRVRYLKPLQTGDVHDTPEIERLTGRSFEPPVVSLLLPASVDQAAEAEDTHVAMPDVLAGVRARLASDPEAIWVLECAGGLRVPLNDHEDQLDMLTALGLPLLLIARSGLGTLNHSLLSIDAARARGLRLLGMVLSGPPHEANEKTLGTWAAQVPQYRLPRLEPLDAETLATALDTRPFTLLDEWLAEAGPRTDT